MPVVELTELSATWQSTTITATATATATASAAAETIITVCSRRRRPSHRGQCGR